MKGYPGRYVQRVNTINRFVPIILINSSGNACEPKRVIGVDIIPLAEL